jgi:hypothetical protein
VLPQRRIATLPDQVCAALKEYEDLVGKVAGTILEIASAERVHGNAVELAVSAISEVCVPATNWVMDVLRELEAQGG